MPRILFLLALVTGLLVLPVAAEGQPSARIRGTVVLKDEPSHIVTLRTPRQAVALRVPGSTARIRVGQRVELRRAILRARGNGLRVLARNVSIASTRSFPTSNEPADDEVELKGTIESLSPLTVSSRTRSATCTVPAGVTLAGFAVGDFVEITCDLIGGSWVLRVLKHEDENEQEDQAEDEDEDENQNEHEDDEGEDEHDDDDSGHGGGGNGGRGNSGPGGGGNDD